MAPLRSAFEQGCRRGFMRFLFGQFFPHARNLGFKGGNARLQFADRERRQSLTQLCGGLGPGLIPIQGYSPVVVQRAQRPVR